MAAGKGGHRLTAAQKSSIVDLLEGNRSHDSIKHPLCWHQIVLHWNWDDGVEQIAWICKQKKCDRGTALTAYWLATPEFYADFKTREEAEKAGCDLGSYDLVRDIEARFASGFHKSAEIGYDPRAGFENVDPLPVPEVMKAASPGEPFEQVELQTVCIRPLSGKDRSSIELKLKHAWKFLGRTPDEEAPPKEIVAQIESAASAHLSVTKDAKERRKVEVLGWLWMQMAVRQFGWEMLAWDWESGAALMVFSPDKSWCVLGPHLVSFGSDTHHIDASAVTELFAAMADIGAYPKRENFVGCGILKRSAHLPFRP